MGYFETMYLIDTLASIKPKRRTAIIVGTIIGSLVLLAIIVIGCILMYIEYGHSKSQSAVAKHKRGHTGIQHSASQSAVAKHKRGHTGGQHSAGSQHSTSSAQLQSNTADVAVPMQYGSMADWLMCVDPHSTWTLSLSTEDNPDVKMEGRRKFLTCERKSLEPKAKRVIFRSLISKHYENKGLLATGSGEIKINSLGLVLLIYAGVFDVTKDCPALAHGSSTTPNLCDMDYNQAESLPYIVLTKHQFSLVYPQNPSTVSSLPIANIPMTVLAKPVYQPHMNNILKLTVTPKELLNQSFKAYVTQGDIDKSDYPNSRIFLNIGALPIIIDLIKQKTLSEDCSTPCMINRMNQAYGMNLESPCKPRSSQVGGPRQQFQSSAHPDGLHTQNPSGHQQGGQGQLP